MLLEYIREGRRDVADSYAMDASSNMHACLYRSGYDVSLPLAPKRHTRTLAEVAPSERTFFLTTKVLDDCGPSKYPRGLSSRTRQLSFFLWSSLAALNCDVGHFRRPNAIRTRTQGTVYLSRHGSEERMSIVPLHDDAHGVIMSMHCFELHDEHLLPENVEYCEALKDRYEDHDYDSLMNTTFGLVPAGRSPGTYRLAEVMGAGAIPVIVARDVILPFREHFDWSSFSFWFTPDQVESEMMATLRAVPRTQLEEMQVCTVVGSADRSVGGVHCELESRAWLPEISGGSPWKMHLGLPFSHR